MGDKRVRLAIVGGNRGGSFYIALSELADRIELVAICDLNEKVLQEWKDKYPEIQTYTDYDKMLQEPSIDAVVLASPLLLHARQAIAALQAGKHVLSEVIAAHTLEDSWELVETVEKTGLVYMMAENYCFTRSNLMIHHMVKQGMFGEITHLEGSYIHELRESTHHADGSLTWRGQLHQQYNGMNYPTHSLGPVAQWIELNKRNGDELESMATFVSKSRALQNYYEEHFGKGHPGAQSDYWQQGDSAVTVLKTKKGVLITLRVDWSSERPHNARHYVLQGTEGAYVSGRHDQEEGLIWLRGRSPKMEDGENGWEPLQTYQPEYDHPLWKRWEKQAAKTRHGGGDFFVLEEFIAAIQENRAPIIDVYDAVTLSCVFPLSMESVAAGGQVINFPNFNKNNQARSRRD
ncbi:alpha-N-acetylgalactosaminidase [Paenibacillus baekrokdamisoli]|uniref:Alpha-N-acetylgalactosaminidase n=1 Tax=Paenibacillus baekrokdamisoli TaxID=1712516 RepID=A0A3G9JBP3_9BACL|nr:Gfo/Idh/MocA family oxidoreductase [Paenibacillus baekrokdamisoli]MBB3072605.1 putative dehydrogenase [Paenibacillus baekrokdamisoli]BBH22343.1 alpha-N-acetylgalactosaminidase [Paenibacillus baekrokdamisoli]